MVFPWHVPHVNPELSSSFKDKAVEMYRKEVRERASMLLRLGFSEEEAVSRCSAYTSWDHAVAGSGSPIAKEVKALVHAVYGGTYPSKS